LDPIQTDIILKKLKEIVKEKKINIIIVHQYLTNLGFFDRVISAKKDIFSEIEDIRL
jgi:ABC-type phosphate/phosphonate transport system ATPase subunit